MTGEPGEYWFTSSGSDAVCSLYLIADVDKLVEFEIMEFDIDCEGGGLFTVKKLVYHFLYISGAHF